ncbi:3-keto-5-aminohexanoate cleavage protein [Leisingera daeponensis]|uniref:3-keto-5-aminohexanoate cleavage protein n=1 Tax=Leisingera daeponensis TaxID=405746 RepID=UPI000428C30C|nr:3-keto-5-aminohexanoate cleavage protein [Leisingera daeponensis]
MSSPCIICVAITGSLPQKSDNPAVPVSIGEQVESTQAAHEAGASIVHVHVRNPDGTPSSSPERFARLLEGLRKHCPDIVVQFSTGGRSGAGRDRGRMLPLKPDMASLSVGSNNFPARVYENPPQLVDWLAAEMAAYGIRPEIEAFDLSHILMAHRMWQDGRLRDRPYVQFVMGVQNAMPADREVFNYYVQTMHRLFGTDAPWCAAGIGRHQIELNDWAIRAGGHVRTGLEDNVRLDRDTLAPSNAALVARAAALCARHQRPVATPAETRAILGLHQTAAA